MTAHAHSTDTPPSRDEQTLRKQAVAWYARLCSGDASDADRAAWQRWHEQHPDHQQAWRRIEAMRATLQQVPANIAAPALRLSAQGGRRRQALRGIGLLVSGGTLGYVVYRGIGESDMARPLLADYRTGVGRQRSVQLADGSLMVLNTDSAADVHFSVTERLVRLRAGEILIETAHQRQPISAADPRPFVVQTAQGRVTALGTRFTVRQYDGYSEVAVLEHAVEVRAADMAGAPDQPVLLHAGQRARFTSSRIDAPAAADDNAGQWRSGHLLVNDRSLQEVLAELSRYRHGRLGCDPAVAGLRISGVFPLADTDRALTLLTQSFPLRQRSLTRYWVTLAPR